MRELAEQLLKAIRKQESIHAGDRVAVAVSGGADSVALLRLLLELRAELGIVLSVAHVNHKLRGTESDEDERFVAELARQHRLDLHVYDGPVDRSLRSESGSGIEAAARELRYGFFRRLARAGRVAKVATAHTLDDQAETVLLRIFRGTGIRGLSGIHPRIVFEEQGRAFGEVVRPLLGFRRAALMEFLHECGQGWREDASNRDIAFLRNRVRHRLLPLIAEEFGEAAIEHMAELAEIARAEEEVLSTQYPVPGTQQTEAGKTRQAASLPVGPLLALPLAAQRRLLRGWLQANARDLSISFRLIEEALELAHGPAGKKTQLPQGILRRGRLDLLLESKPFGGRREAGHRQAPDYEYALAVPGAVKIHELGASHRSPRGGCGERSGGWAWAVTGSGAHAEGSADPQLAGGRSLLAGTYRGGKESEGTADRAPCDWSREEALAGCGRRRLRARLGARVCGSGSLSRAGGGCESNLDSGDRGHDVTLPSAISYQPSGNPRFY